MIIIIMTMIIIILTIIIIIMLMMIMIIIVIIIYLMFWHCAFSSRRSLSSYLVCALFSVHSAAICFLFYRNCHFLRIW